LIYSFELRLIATHPDCDKEKLEYLEFVFYKIKLSILEDVYPRNPADLFNILLSEMDQMRNQMYHRSSDLMSSDVDILLDLDKMRADLLKLDVVIKEFIEKYTKDVIHEKFYPIYLLRRVSITCNNIHQMEKLLSDMRKEFSKSESNCEDEELKKLFIRQKYNFVLVDDTDVKRKKRFEKYMSIIRFWCRNDFDSENYRMDSEYFERFKKDVKLFEKLREQIKTLIK